jgi:hypothetical protein
MSHRTIASGAVDEPFVCPRCFDFKCSFEPNLEAHLRQCRRRELPAHLEVIYPPSNLFPTPAQLREAQKRPASNEGLSSLVKASRIVPNTVAVQTVFAAPPQQAAPVAPRRGRPPKEQSMIVPRGGKLTVTSPAGLGTFLPPMRQCSATAKPSARQVADEVSVSQSSPSGARHAQNASSARAASPSRPATQSASTSTSTTTARLRGRQKSHRPLNRANRPGAAGAAERRLRCPRCRQLLPLCSTFRRRLRSPSGRQAYLRDFRPTR